MSLFFKILLLSAPEGILPAIIFVNAMIECPFMLFL